MQNNKLFVANFKMNKTNTDVAEYFSVFPIPDKNYKNKVVFCVPSTSLYFASAYMKGEKMSLGAENIYYGKSGAFTGEVSADMITDCGAEYVIIGHSERRGIFNETDEIVNKKVISALDAGLNVILCIGETMPEREGGQTESVLSRQVEQALQGVSDYNKIIIAYEPVWAIGTSAVANNEQIAEVIAMVKKIVDVPVLYGGSATEKNADEILSIENISGLLVGGAALDPVRFSKICQL